MTIRLGIVGACGRGASYKHACDAFDALELRAVCDVNEAGLPDAQQRLGAAKAYTDYEQMLDDADLDAVILGTPMPFHVPQAIAALKRDLHVVSEVPAGVSIDECRELVLTAEASRGTYMLAENFIFMRHIMTVKQIINEGLFGDLYYGEGEYLHELKGLNEITKWRRTWQTGINGITYGTHSLGPLLYWMRGDRVESVCCAGAGHHYRDAAGRAYEAEDTSVMLCNLRSGGLVKIRVDMLSDRPHSMNNHELQGSDGCFESARAPAPGGPHRIWLRELDTDVSRWFDLSELEDRFLPKVWREHEELAKQSGHGGGDLIEMADMVAALEDGAPPTVGIHDAMDMTLPGLVSQASIHDGGRWMDVPDSREWV